ncbi:MAG: DUF1641 domain-containing protein [Acidimicrobiia bacterium]|nr:DUF1641 domain-containing protein [Acidimicrobiia bacterium]
MTTVNAEATIAELNEKLDRLTVQVEYLTEQAIESKRRRQGWDELLADVTPLAGDMYGLAVRQLAEVDQYVSIQDLGHLIKRLVRNTGNLEKMLDQLESLMDIFVEIQPITGDVSLKLMNALDEYERKGYFDFVRSSLGVVDNVVTSFTKEDVNALGDNVVLILQAVREMTQPQVMTMLRNTASNVREQEVPEDISLFGLLKQMRDPAVKRGMARALGALRSVAGDLPEQPEQ